MSSRRRILPRPAPAQPIRLGAAPAPPERERALDGLLAQSGLSPEQVQLARRVAAHEAATPEGASELRGLLTDEGFRALSSELGTSVLAAIANHPGSLAFIRRFIGTKSFLEPRRNEQAVCEARTRLVSQQQLLRIVGITAASMANSQDAGQAALLSNSLAAIAARGSVLLPGESGYGPALAFAALDIASRLPAEAELAAELYAALSDDLRGSLVRSVPLAARDLAEASRPRPPSAVPRGKGWALAFWLHRHREGSFFRCEVEVAPDGSLRRVSECEVRLPRR